jgi:hypothetical protein
MGALDGECTFHYLLLIKNDQRHIVLHELPPICSLHGGADGARSYSV